MCTSGVLLKNPLAGSRECHFNKLYLKEVSYGCIFSIFKPQWEQRTQKRHVSSAAHAVRKLFSWWANKSFFMLMISDTCSLTTGERSIKGSLCGSIRPRTDAAARWADTHSTGMRSQAALGKVQSPKRRKQSWNVRLSTKTTRQSYSDFPHSFFTCCAAAETMLHKRKTLASSRDGGHIRWMWSSSWGTGGTHGKHTLSF